MNSILFQKDVYAIHVVKGNTACINLLCYTNQNKLSYCRDSGRRRSLRHST